MSLATSHNQREPLDVSILVWHAMIELRVTMRDQTTTEQRYFISSLSANAKELEEAIRSHWAIKNSLRWVLGVTIGEDLAKVCNDHTPEKYGDGTTYRFKFVTKR